MWAKPTNSSLFIWPITWHSTMFNSFIPMRLITLFFSSRPSTMSWTFLLNSLPFHASRYFILLYFIGHRTCETFIRPFPSSPGPLYQNEVRCSTFLVEMSFIFMRMKNRFHIKGWAPNLVLMQRPGGTRKCPIAMLLSSNHFVYITYWLVKGSIIAVSKLSIFIISFCVNTLMSLSVKSFNSRQWYDIYLVNSCTSSLKSVV